MKRRNKVEYALLVSGIWLITRLPLKLLFLISEFITLLVYRVIGYRHAVVIENLHHSFPELPEKEIVHLARKYYRHLSVMIIENLYLRFVTEKQFVKRLEIEKREVFEQLYQKGKNIIVVMGHTGNWEFAAGMTRFISYRGAAIYKKLTSPAVDKLYFDIRKRLGVIPVEMKEVFRKVVELGQENEPFILFMLADQSPTPGETHHWTTFLNQDTQVFMGPEKLAKKFDMPVVYCEIQKEKKGKYRAIPSVITEHPTETQPYEITERYYQLLEESIRRSPRYWLWSHRRWKYKRETPGENLNRKPQG